MGIRDIEVKDKSSEPSEGKNANIVINDDSERALCRSFKVLRAGKSGSDPTDARIAAITFRIAVSVKLGNEAAFNTSSE